MRKVQIPVAIAVVMTLATGGWVVASRRAEQAPPFTRGGNFAMVEDSGGGTPAKSGKVRRAAEKDAARQRETQTEQRNGGARQKTASASRAAAPSQSAAAPVAASSQAAAQPSREQAANGSPSRAPAGTASDASPGAAPGHPAFGTYTYDVDGWESATAFGRRNYPKRMTAVIHGADGLPDTDVVMDLSFSEDHEEREIIRTNRQGAAFTFEGGQITFGPGTQASEAEYRPPLAQIPFPLQRRSTLTGTSRAFNSEGQVVRVEDWTTTVIGRETLTVLGEPTTTWVVDVDRKTREGGAEQLRRSRRYWYDPQRSLWVQWQETFHGERDQAGFRFAYDTQYTAKLVAVES